MLTHIHGTEQMKMGRFEFWTFEKSMRFGLDNGRAFVGGVSLVNATSYPSEGTLIPFLCMLFRGSFGPWNVCWRIEVDGYAHVIQELLVGW